MKSVNKVLLLGHVGTIESKTLSDDTVVTNFSLATNERWTGKDNEKHESVEWHRCEAWGKLGELVGQFLKKGSAVHVEGRLRPRSGPMTSAPITTRRACGWTSSQHSTAAASRLQSWRRRPDA